MKTITYRRQAAGKLRKMPRNDSARIIAKINQYAENPASLANNVKALQGQPYYRLRVGDWRVIFDENDVVIDILRVDARGRIYR